MRAERDEEDFDYKPIRRTKERRLAYEIAMGIFIGGCALITTIDIKNYIEARLMLSELQIQFGK
ncbi:MAG: hypothetical protein ACREXR_16150 [Gammaproteobacteria bacterium]